MASRPRLGKGRQDLPPFRTKVTARPRRCNKILTSCCVGSRTARRSAPVTPTTTRGARPSAVSEGEGTPESRALFWVRLSPE
jgi:hypothetical protein